MGGVSNVGPTGSNGNDSTRVVASGRKEAKVNAFEAYRQFKQQVQNEYNNYQNDVKKEYEEYKNNALKEYNSFRENVTTETSFDEAYEEALKNPENWQKYEVHEGIKPPIMNKPKEAPVYIPEDSVEGSPSTNPTEEVKDTKPAVDEEKPVKPTATEDEKPVLKQVSRKGVSGGYNISAGENGQGFSLQTNMRVTMLGEARKFFANANTMALDDKDKVKKDKDGYYVYRGIKTKNYNVLRQQLTLSSQKISINNAIYNDLMTKKNSGTELTEAEQNFIKYHLKTLESNKLGVDENGNLIDKM